MKEQDLVNAIIDLIRYRGGVATRINAGMQVIDQPTGRRVVRGAPAGTSDILACYRGYYLAIECKIGSNKPTALQELFLADVEAAGGIALVAWDVETVINLVDGLDHEDLMKEMLERAILAERRVVKLEMVLQEIAERAGTSKNVDWARRRALEALKKEEVEG